MMWTQNYIPLRNLAISTFVAALPVIAVLGLLAFVHLRAHFAALLGLLLAIAIAIFVYGMPAPQAVASAGYGAAFGLLPIGWIVLNAIFVYDISVNTGKFEIVKETIAGLAADRRIQVLIIGFAFGAFIEGAAGFGTPVAISAAILIGLGFNPLLAAGLCLIGNTAPVAFGALGIPIITLAKVTGLNEALLSSMVGRQLPLFSCLVPFWLIVTMSGWKGMKEVWPACLVAGLAFAVPQFIVSNFYGPSLVDIVSSISCILAIYILLKFWQPKTIWRFPEERDEATRAVVTHSMGSAFMAWLPWIVLSVFVFIWGLPEIKTYLNSISNPTFEVPWLHNLVQRVPPVVKVPTLEAAKYSFSWISATGTGLLLSGIISGFLLKMSVGDMVKTYLSTIYRIRFSLLTITAMLALGFTTRYSGSDTTMGLALASTGTLFPFFSPLLGWLGVALTGSDTSSNVLFGNLQVVSAQQIGMSPLLAAAANSSGGVMGKMIDAQSIVVASVATNMHGREGEILRYVFWHSLVLACLVGVAVMLQAYVFTSMIPQ